MCLAVPGRIMEIHDNKAVADIMGVFTEISIQFVKGEIHIDDYVLVHAGCAMQKLDRLEAEENLELFEELKGIANG
jgi:hydrogenase expression/formation protein HypC